MTELKPCPFCGRQGVEIVICGAAVPDCPKCSNLYGCNHCDVWVDTDSEWNTRNDKAVIDEFLAAVNDREFMQACDGTAQNLKSYRGLVDEVYAERYGESK